MISQGKKVIEERLQRKREQCIHQKEKLEQMKCTMRKTEEEVEQLEYVLHEIEHIEKSKREPRVIPNAEISNVFASLCREFDYLQHRLKLASELITSKYKLVCEVIFARYQFRSRSHVPGREYLSYATVLTYFKRERGMVNS